MHKSKIRLVPTACNPPMHTTQMAINAIPHYFANETANRLEAFHTIEFGHSERSVVAVALVNYLTPLNKVRFSTAGGDGRIRIDSRNQYLKVTRRQPQIQIELAEKIIVFWLNGAISRVQ